MQFLVEGKKTHLFTLVVEPSSKHYCNIISNDYQTAYFRTANGVKVW